MVEISDIIKSKTCEGFCEKALEEIVSKGYKVKSDKESYLHVIKEKKLWGKMVARIYHFVDMRDMKEYLKIDVWADEVLPLVKKYAEDWEKNFKGKAEIYRRRYGN